MSGALVVSLHDVHPGSFEDVRAQVETLSGMGVSRFSLLAVPNFHGLGDISLDGALCGWLRERASLGDEIVLHGYHHLRIGRERSWRTAFWTDFYTSNEAEFLDLEQGEARTLLKRGRGELEAAGLEARGFIAPAWLMSGGVLKAIWDEGFEYTNTVSHLIAAGRHERCRSWCWSSRAAWRRLCSLIWNRAIAGAVLGQRVARLSLHPNDLYFPRFREQIIRLAGRALASGRRPTTYAEACAELAKGRYA